MRAVRFSIALVLTLAGASPSVPAENPELDFAEAWLRTRANAGHRQSKVSEIRQQFIQAFYQSDLDGGGISARDYELAELLERAGARAGRIGSLAARDLDGDGVITRSELETFFLRHAHQPMRAEGGPVAPTQEQVTAIHKRLVDEALRQDLDKDGRITWLEMAAEPENDRSRARWTSKRNVLPTAFDNDKDGVVTLKEFEDRVDRFLASIDKNADGVLSPDEANDAQKDAQFAQQRVNAHETEERQKEEARERLAACNLPKAPVNARIIYLAATMGSAIASASVDGGRSSTTAIHVEVEKGDTPLFIIAVSTSPVIWQFTGAKERVSSLVASSIAGDDARRKPYAGVEGLKSGQVVFATRTDCIGWVSDQTNLDGIRAMNEISGWAGRKPDDFISRQTVGKVSLPTGIATEARGYPVLRLLPKSGPGAVIWKELSARGAGIADVDADHVIASDGVKPYDVLPGAAGIAQLLDDGVLEVARMARVRRFGNVTIQGEGQVIGQQPTEESATPIEFRILKPTKLPANVEHGLKFILAKGVAPPTGDLSKVVVIAEETGAPVPGSRMR